MASSEIAHFVPSSIWRRWRWKPKLKIESTYIFINYKFIKNIHKIQYRYQRCSKYLLTLTLKFLNIENTVEQKITLCNFEPNIKITCNCGAIASCYTRQIYAAFFYLRGFNAISVLSCFLHFCGEQKLTHKSCLWSKNDKKDVC